MAVAAWAFSPISESRAYSLIVAHGLSSSEARGILPDQGMNLCLLPWEMDSSH